jgi:hypothetical protein
MVALATGVFVRAVVTTVGVATIRTVALAPGARLPRVQVTVTVAVPLVAQPPVVGPLVKLAELKVRAVSVSVTFTTVAVFGPLLVTVMLYVMGCPTLTGSGESDTVSVKSAMGLNAAVTVLDLSIVTEQTFAATLAQPFQEMNCMPGSATGVKETTVPVPYVCEQSAPQAMPPSALVTVPVPPPVFATVSSGTVKVALTAFAALIVMEQVETAPEQLPVQPPK